MARQDYEQMLAWQVTAAGLPTPTPQLRFHPTRKWTFDLAWPDRKVACEVEGGIWTGGRHTRGAGFEKDASKYNEAEILGWTVLRVSVNQVKRGEALAWIERALKAA